MEPDHVRIGSELTWERACVDAPYPEEAGVAGVDHLQRVELVHDVRICPGAVAVQAVHDTRSLHFGDDGGWFLPCGFVTGGNNAVPCAQVAIYTGGGGGSV